ncbi:hypothetical protein DFR70_12841 [Nocardia tenerifensis]|uniref:Uncharacterized protein n=1 Tax=Nocardia tenerifensis TaxID=228006 RepID=A0A318JLT7_9NOCA|nr:hypothetical protein [Nocardia tenerifensis]PXX53328.1 hypothetical protein DFR70_12841 [Nocardia tenerifensis]
MSGTDVPEEHRRYWRYRRELAAVSAEAETELVTTVLHDEDTVMAVAAIVEYFDRRAAQLIPGNNAHFDRWASTMSELAAGHDFLIRRLREWTLLQSITLGHKWSPAEILTATDWFQRKAAATATAPDVLALLAEQGRTRRVRNATELRRRNRGANPQPS